VNPNYSNEGRNYPAPTGGFVSADTTPSTNTGVTYSTGTGDFFSQYGPDQYGPGISAGETLNRQMAQDRADAAAAAQNYSNEGRNYGGGGRSNDGGGVATGGNNGDASGGGDRGTRGGFAYGGYVSMQDLQGPNPEGPDDGYAALKDGEYVINDQAVNQYGIELMNLINSGKISKGELLGLLEM
jgi:hypothetical protein